MKTKKMVVLVTISFIVSFLFGPITATPVAATNLQASTLSENQTIDDVEAQFHYLKHHGEALGFYREFPTRTANPDVWHHYQGIQRLPGPGIPYFFVTQSADDIPGYLNVIRMASRDTSGERLRSNRFLKGYDTDNTGPPINDKVVHVVEFNGYDGWPRYAHPGGLQMVGDILAVPLEDPLDDGLPEGMIVLVDVSNPMNPVNLYEKAVYHRCGDVAIIQHAYLSESLGRFLMLVVGGDNEEIFVYESTVVEDLRDPNLDFSHVYTWKYTELVGPDDKEWPHGGGDGYQSINFIRQSDGQLFLIGTRNTDWPGVPGAEDWAELYRVLYLNGKLKLYYRDAKHFYCNYDRGGRIGNFRAAAGIYISPSGELILYATEHEDGGPLGSVRMGEFRHLLVNRPGSPLLRPTADAGGPYFVAEGSSITLSGSALPPEAKPWAELYEDRYFEGRSLVFDWADRFEEDLNDFDEHDGFGDTAESVIWRAPVGCDIILYEHEDYGGKQLVLPGTGLVEIISDLTSYPIGEETSSIRFTGDCEGTDMTFEWWTLNDHDIFDGEGETPTFSAALLDGPRTVDIGLRVWGVYGEFDESLTSVTVHNVPPTATIDSMDQPNPHFILPVVHTLTFTGSFTDPGVPDTHTAEWDFGDGTVSSGTMVEENVPPDSTGLVTGSHVYSDPGTYTVTLTITDDDGGFDTDTMQVTVLSAKEVNEFIDQYIEDLAGTAFKGNPPKRKSALGNKFAAVDDMLEDEEWNGAIHALTKDIRAKADGSVDGKPADDWITDPAAQLEICMMIDDLVAYLRTLL